MSGQLTAPGTVINFIVTRGRPPVPAMAWEEITRPGVHGIEVRQEGRRGAPGTVEVSIAGSSRANAQSAAAALEGLIGHVVTFTDSAGDSRANLLLQAAEVQEPQRVTKAVGFTGTHVVKATITLIDLRGSA